MQKCAEARTNEIKLQKIDQSSFFFYILQYQDFEYCKLLTKY